MLPEVKRDFEYGRQFLPQLRVIAGNYLIGEAPFEEDAEHATDLIVLRLEAVRIACRVRRPDYLRYSGEFTVRAERPHGIETELGKILAGWGDYFLYGFGGDMGTLKAWVLGDLKVFRRWFASTIARLPAGQIPGDRRLNGDGSSAFQVFRIADLPSEFVIARKKATQTTGPNQ